VFLNLVKNAAEAIGDAADGEIVLTTAFRPASGCRCRAIQAASRCRWNSASGQRPGVPEDLMPHLFDPFVTTKPNGTGLGLALVAKIVGDHGGVIECESQPRRTVFRVLMPMPTPWRRPSKEERTEMTDARRQHPGRRRRRAIRTVLNQALSRPATRCAHRQRRDAVALGQQGEGDLVITDVVMPDENAFDLLPRIKKLRPDLPIIVMSAQNTFMTAIRRPSAAPTSTCPSRST
jgi:CheY-like chemotaxis protein